MNEIFIKFIAVYLLIIMLAGTLLIFRNKIRTFFTSALLGWLTLQIIIMVIKSIIKIPRPYLSLDITPLVLIPPTNSSFPSEHSALAFLIATLVFFQHNKWGIIYFAGALLVGIGRILANVHYPIDIIFGSILGITTGIIIKEKSKLFTR